MELFPDRTYEKGANVTIQELFKLGMDRNIPHILNFPDGKVLNVGAGNKSIEGAIPLDLPEWNSDLIPIPYPACTIAGIHCYHFLEHLVDPVKFLREAQRVLILNGLINIVTPFWNCQMNWQDLDHKHSFTETTWKVLFENPYYNKNQIVWKLKVHTCFIMGLDSKNLALFSQLYKYTL